MTHSLSVTGADNPPAIYRSATLAIVVSKTSMNVGITTAPATSQGLTGLRSGVTWSAMEVMVASPVRSSSQA